MNLVLVGFMGTGKTVVGQKVAATLRVPFVDIDQEIERKYQRTIAEIFKAGGEAAFRKIEMSAIAEVALIDHAVIATGGGALLNSENARVLSKNGLLVCLRATVDTLVQRLGKDSSRPLLAGEPLKQKLENLLKERESVYAACPIQIPTDNQSVEQTAGNVLRQIEGRFPS